MITAVLMAAGYSRRFHSDKLMLPLGGKPLLAHTMEAVNHCPFSQRLLIYRDPAYIALAQQYQFQHIENTNAKEGQSASLRLGVQKALPNHALMFFTGDQPYLTPAVIQTLLETHRRHPDAIILPVINGHNKSPAIFPASFRSNLLKVTGDMGGRTIIRQYPETVIKVPFSDERAFFDIDTPDHYCLALSWTSTSASLPAPPSE